MKRQPAKYRNSGGMTAFRRLTGSRRPTGVVRWFKRPAPKPAARFSSRAVSIVAVKCEPLSGCNERSFRDRLVGVHDKKGFNNEESCLCANGPRTPSADGMFRYTPQKPTTAASDPESRFLRNSPVRLELLCGAYGLRAGGNADRLGNVAALSRLHRNSERYSVLPG